jgi:cytidylate kinase
MISIAIDGPAGAGKSTIARKVAADLCYLYIDTGALYRTIGLYALRSGVSPTDREAVAALLPEIRVNLAHADGVQQVFLNGENVSEEIRRPEMSMAASGVSAQPEVRAFLLELQRQLARENNVLMDGRDIGTVVLPNAQVKIFLTASPEKRADRRYKEQLEKGDHSQTYEQVLADIIQRDYNDSHRAIAPLRQADDAVLADTSNLTLDESIELIKTIIRSKTEG